MYYVAVHYTMYYALLPQCLIDSMKYLTSPPTPPTVSRIIIILYSYIGRFISFQQVVFRRHRASADEDIKRIFFNRYDINILNTLLFDISTFFFSQFVRTV